MGQKFPCQTHDCCHAFLLLCLLKLSGEQERRRKSTRDEEEARVCGNERNLDHFTNEEHAKGIMVTLHRPRVEDSRQFQFQGVHSPKTVTEFRVITLKEPIVDPEWMFHHPRFQREMQSSEKFPKIEPGFLKNTKKIFSRVPSARVNARRRILCERRERDQSNSTCRHFCELLGPNLCKDCWKLVERSDAVKENRESCTSEMLKGDPFNSMIIALREKRFEDSDHESEEGMLNEAEDDEFIFNFPSSRKHSSMPPSAQDSGYSSRMSYIRSLSRTPSGDFHPRVRSPLTPSLLRERRSSQDEERDKDISTTTSHISSNLESTSIWKNAYLTKLREREPFKKVLNNDLYYPCKVRHAWRDLPVEPVVMDLKLINFTIYDGSVLNEREASKTAKA